MKSSLPVFKRVSPWRAAFESLLVFELLLAGLLWLSQDLSRSVLGRGVLVLVASAVLLFALRARIQEGAWQTVLLKELAYAGWINLALVGGPALINSALDLVTRSNLVSTLLRANQGSRLFLALLFPIPAYLFFRLAVRLLLAWNRLRKRKLMWSLVHFQMVLASVIALAYVILAAFLTLQQNLAALPAGAPLPAAIAQRVITTLIPLISMSLLLLGLTIFVVLPPMALLSYWIARRVTRRLSTLTITTAELRRGGYSARMVVSGEDEVAQLQADFNGMAASLEETLGALQAERDKVSALLRVQRELAASVSHELRTPVATIQGYLEPALDDWSGPPEPPPATLHADLETVDRETRRLSRLIEDLFTLSQAEVGHLSLNLEVVDAGRIVQRVADTFAPLAWGRGRIELAAQLSSAPLPALADEGRLEQALANLVRNALRHTPPGGIVVLAVAAEPEGVCIEVRDTGEGIPAEDLPHIWDRFYRVQASEYGSDGAGLGLALVKELVEAMGGRVGVQSARGQGSCFTIRLGKMRQS
jgi:signal transduction histidine kinase